MIMLEINEEGFLINRHQWNKEIALLLAHQEKLALTPDHWEVLSELQKFYEQFSRHPALRVLIKLLANRWSIEKANSLYLHQLFPGGVIKQASKLAGLPKPLKCL